MVSPTNHCSVAGCFVTKRGKVLSMHTLYILQITALMIQRGLCSNQIFFFFTNFFFCEIVHHRNVGLG